MSGYLYWPYDEVTLEASATRDKITVKTPWMEATVKGPIEPSEDFESLLQKFQRKEILPNDIHLINWFFRNFEKYPLCYILPTDKGKTGLDVHEVKSADFAEKTLKEMLPVETLGPLPRQEFAWDLETSLTFSKLGDEVHPESLLTVARRYHILELLENDKGKEVFQFVESLPKEQFAEFAAKIVKQNLYVTEKCQESLTPALQLAKSARPLIEHFIQQERGHDRLLGAAMKSIAKNPETIPVSPQTVTLMNLLRMAAERNFLAFAIAVDFFERSSYEKMDPLAKLLLKGGFSEAAKQINLHMEINDSGGHENMGLQFLASMAPCDPVYAREAMKIAEAISLVMNSVTRSAIQS
jgi:hypothetical protein